MNWFSWTVLAALVVIFFITLFIELRGFWDLITGKDKHE